MKKQWIAVLWCFMLSFGQANAQVDNVTFGQNRVQYKDFTFSYYETDHYTVYFYQGGQDVAKYVIKQSENIAEDLQRLLDMKFRSKIDIVVYNSINELNQTNIGIYEPKQNSGGTTQLPSNKAFVYFDGTHDALDYQLRKRLTEIYMNKLLAGATVLEFIQNAVAMNMPDWFKRGFIEYYAEPWNSNAEDRLRDGIMSGRFSKLNKLEPDEAMFVGKSVWHYVEERYGKQAVGNLLYLSRINRSVENGFQFVLGQGVDETLTDWFNYYLERYIAESAKTMKRNSSYIVNYHYKRGIDYYQPRLSNDGKTLLYAKNDMGRYHVKLLDTETKKHKVLVRGGFRTNTIFTDDKQPLIAWAPDGKQAAIVFEKKKRIYLGIWDNEKKKLEVKSIEKFQKVVQIAYAGDSKNLVMSAVQAGQSDIYLYKIASTTTTKLTNDYFDDLYPTYAELSNARGIIFSSNRGSAELKEERYQNQSFFNRQLDLYFISLDDLATVHRITNTPMANEIYPQQFSEDEFAFLSDANGIYNRFTGILEDGFSHWQIKYATQNRETGSEDTITLGEGENEFEVIDTSIYEIKSSTKVAVNKLRGITLQQSNYLYNIREQQILPQKNLMVELVKQNNKILFYKMPLDSTSHEAASFVSSWGKISSDNINADKQKADSLANVKAILQKNTQHTWQPPKPHDFQSEFDYKVLLFDWDSVSKIQNNAVANAMEESGFEFKQTKVRPYFVRFSVDDIISQLDNNLILTRYQPFNPNNPNFYTPPVSFAIKFGVTDVLENHKVYGGFRLPFSNIKGNSEYFISYEYLQKRLDHKYTYYRQSITQNNIAIKTNYFEASYKYALDVLQHLGFGFAFRSDKTVYKAVDSVSLYQPNQINNWLYFKGEYVFDNTIQLMDNIRYGFRAKAFFELHKEFPFKNKKAGSDYTFNLPSMNNAWFAVIGADARYYQKIYRKIIWASRISAATSLGNRKLIYYLGAVDNWFISERSEKFDKSTPINTNNNYAFQTLATPLRGFLQNARNGNSYVVLNTEIRFPLFSTFRRAPIRSEFIRNFMLVGFFDAGTAWEGLSPFDGNNLYSETYTNSVSTIKIKRYKTPVIMGFGAGLRTSLLGYFMKMDLAWGYDTGVITKRPIFYFTFGYDF
ncbi:MAG TPA: hypothetical protein PLM55_09245 [Chitinophagales bacterium]|nr:hypothetical protein [Chitinophagales bacterium]